MDLNSPTRGARGGVVPHCGVYVCVKVTGMQSGGVPPPILPIGAVCTQDAEGPRAVSVLGLGICAALFPQVASLTLPLPPMGVSGLTRPRVTDNKGDFPP